MNFILYLTLSNNFDYQIMIMVRSKKFSISLILNIDQDSRSMYTGHLSSYIILERDLLLNIKGLNSK